MNRDTFIPVNIDYDGSGVRGWGEKIRNYGFSICPSDHASTEYLAFKQTG
ncbi:MAG: hypothetical protein F6K09_04210 [Merismopedia sp. SIO2A8]|nr:hypothetical protein [Symploca sp. SIO2B6]NET47928.1 hypothetical protein [Merismopedia sp. SIO2A8]